MNIWLIQEELRLEYIKYVYAFGNEIESINKNKEKTNCNNKRNNNL